MPVFTIVFTSS